MRSFAPIAVLALSCLTCTSTPSPGPSIAQGPVVPATVAASPPASTSNPASTVDRAVALPPLSVSTSMGSPTAGRLTGGGALPLRGPGFVFHEGHDPARRYGTVETVGALVRAAARVRERWPGGVVTLGDLSLEGGGELDGHATHQSGRDVDVYFYLVDARGEPFPSKGIPIEPDGSGVDYRDLARGDDDIPVRIDLARTWEFVAALLTDDVARVNRIYVVEHVRSLLLEYAGKVGAGDFALEQFRAVTCQPNFPHDDHMHVRFFCAPDDIHAGCEDTLPIYPWHMAYLRRLGMTFKPASGRRTSRPKVTSVAQAAAKARRAHGPFHPDVTAFLKRRQAWVSKPHPGREYCP